MKPGRCPYHVKQGVVNTEGKLVLSDICGLKSACASQCPFIPFNNNSFKGCSRYVEFTKGIDRHTLVPKNDLEYLLEVGGSMANFNKSDMV